MSKDRRAVMNEAFHRGELVFVSSRYENDDEIFEDYVAGVVDELWFNIVASDPRIHRAMSMLIFDHQNKDRTIEANLLASVAEEYNLDPDEMSRALSVYERTNLGYE